MNTKEAAKPFEECVKEAETIELYFQQGSSDKVYHLQLHSVEEKWSARRNGERRGSALQSDTKVSSVAYEEAKRVYDRIIREKTQNKRAARTPAHSFMSSAVNLRSRSIHTKKWRRWRSQLCAQPS
jgi:hypothetical protein